MTRQQKIIILSGISLTGIMYLVYNKIKKGQLFDELLFIISNTGSGTGNSNKNTNALKGNLIREIERNNPNRNFIMLEKFRVAEYSKLLHEAMKGWGTEEEEISAVFSKLNDKVAVSQVASYYTSLYNESLYARLKDELNDDDFKVAVSDYLNKMPEVRFT